LIALSGIFSGLLLLIGAANAIAFAVVSIRTSQLKDEGRVSPSTPDFLSAPWDPSGVQFFEHVYTDHHRIYGSRIVTRCVQILRVCAPAFVVLFVVLFAVEIIGR
jgi:hypothetical protein